MFMKSKRIRWILFIYLGIAVWLAVTAAAAESINWRSYEEGMALGKIEKKKVFLHFYADWCAFCLKMAKDTFQDSAVIAYLNQNFISVMVNVDKEQETAVKYGVLGLPFTMFLTQVGEPIFSLPGFIPPDTLLSMLKEVTAANPGG